MNDGGYKSRKMVMAYVAMVLMTAGFLAGGRWTALQTIFGEFVMGLLGAASIYAGSNLGARWVHSKSSPGQDPDPAPAPKAPAAKKVQALAAAKKEPADPLAELQGSGGSAAGTLDPD